MSLFAIQNSTEYRQLNTENTESRLDICLQAIGTVIPGYQTAV